MLRSLLSKAGVKSRARKGKASSQESYQLPSTSSSSSDMQAKHSVSPATNPPSTGFFAGSSNIDASCGVFTDITITGDLNFGVQMQDNALDHSVLNKLPRAKDATWRHGNHQTCLEGTRKLELLRIEEWELNSATKVVCWLSGLAGSGKSTIAQTIAERSHAKGRLGASFLCSRDFQDRRNIHLIFPTLALCLASHSPEFRVALIQIISENPDIGNESLVVQFEDLIIQPLLATQLHTTIIIDALDECEDDQPASAVLSVVARRIDAIPFVKILITGRPERSIRSGFRLRLLRPHMEVFALHEVDRVSVDHDIELYLRTHLSEIGEERGYDAWPSNEEIAAATKKCAGLFIVAYVIVKFVASIRHKPRERLRVISSADSTVHEGATRMDVTYGQVFLHSFADIGLDDTDFLELLQIVVGCIVLAFNPLSCTSLATMLGITSEDLDLALGSLHSVFIVPASELEPIRICHKSLADYLTDANRCTDTRFYIDPPVHHLELGLRCLQLMKKGLKKNICGLPRHAMNADVDDLDRRREKDIGGGLEYACRSWAKHLRLGLREGGNVGVVVELLDDFFTHHMLQWLEVLSIVQDLQCAVYSLHDVASWVAEAIPSDASLLGIIQDSERFLLRFFDAIEFSATHIYESAIPLSPSTSLIRALYEDQMSKDVKIHGMDDTWDACMRTIQLHGRRRRVAFSHNDDLIAVGEEKGVEIFDAATGQRRATLTSNKGIPTLAFSPDDGMLVTVGYDGLVSVWDLQTGGLVKDLGGQTEDIRSVEFSPCGSMIATGSENRTIRIWNVSSFDCQCVLEGHLDIVHGVCWSSTRGEVVSGSEDTTVKLWSVPDKICTRTFTIHSEGVISVASLPNSSLMASGSWDKTIKVFDAATGDVLHTIPTTQDWFDPLRFLDRDHIMYLIGGSLTVRDLVNSVDVLRFNYDSGENLHLGSFGVSSDGTRLASAIGTVMGIWQTNSTSQNPEVANHHTDEVNVISFSSDGQLAATGSDDCTAKIWNTSTGQCLATFHGHSWRVSLVLISPDSTVCASLGFKDIQFWDVQTGNSIAIFVGNRAVNDMCFSPDGSQLAVLDGQFHSPYWVKLHEVATGECLAEIELESEFQKISFDVDGSSVIVRRNDNSQRLRLSSDTSNLSSLPMVFVPVHDTVPSEVDPQPDHQYRYDEKEGPWILDSRDRRVLYVLPDWQRHFHGTSVVFITPAGRVIFVYFRP